MIKKNICRIENISGCIQLYLKMDENEHGYLDIRLEITDYDEDGRVASVPLEKPELAALAAAIQGYLR